MDALLWYAAEILPALAAAFNGAPPTLHVAGYTAPNIDLSMLASLPHIKLHGSTSDLRPLYNAARLFIAPTRYAAGTPYKLYETAAHGLPAITTSLLATQLNWQNNTELLTAPANSPTIFAAQIAKLYQNEPLWTRLRHNALTRLATENTEPAFNTTVATILRTALYTSRALAAV
jgi:glycosyltransferase involved in cell wall biosynthesis